MTLNLLNSAGMKLKKFNGNIEKNAWDGEWYRRAYFDNGLPLGSAGNDECQIDSISQSWSVLSGAGNPDRSRMAMESVNKRLVRHEYSWFNYWILLLINQI